MRKNIITAVIAAILVGGLGMAVPADAAAGLGGHVIDTSQHAKPKPKGRTYSQAEVYRCAGAVLEAQQIIDGGDKSKHAKREFRRKAEQCATVVGGF